MTLTLYINRNNFYSMFSLKKTSSKHLYYCLAQLALKTLTKASKKIKIQQC